MATAIEAVEGTVLSKAAGDLVSPTRHSVNFGDKGSLVFTIGGQLSEPSIAGFRVYDTFRGEYSNRDQLVTVYDSTTGALKGVCIGNRLGAIRTGAIGGLAIRLLSRESSTSLGVVGSGLQAMTQIHAAMSVRKITQISIYNRTEQTRNSFAKEMSEQLGVEVVPVESAKKAVHEKDIVIAATTSSVPVFDSAWISPGTHINTVGPKFKDAHELDPKCADLCETIATDSMAQVEGYSKPFFLAGSKELERMVELSDLLAAPQRFRRSENGITLFCSVGLSGTEVAVANAIFETRD